jgi:hypothetical protein
MIRSEKERKSVDVIDPTVITGDVSVNRYPKSVRNFFLGFRT